MREQLKETKKWEQQIFFPNTTITIRLLYSSLHHHNFIYCSTSINSNIISLHIIASISSHPYINIYIYIYNCISTTSKKCYEETSFQSTFCKFSHGSFGAMMTLENICFTFVIYLLNKKKNHINSPTKTRA